MSTQILERPETKDADTGPEMFHYVRKEKIAESAVMGTFVVALCGEKFPVTKVPKLFRILRTFTLKPDAPAGIGASLK